MEITESAAADGGIQMALTLALAAVIAHHPNREPLLEELRQARERGSAFFLAMPSPEAALASFESTMKTLLNE